MVLDDPELTGIAAVLFDEFHERSLDADLGLAFARDAQQGLREDLKLLVMSATIDGARVASKLGDAPQVESLGRAFPVETRYLPREARTHIEPQVADAVMRALRADPGSALVFLPGQAEIRRTETLLKERVSDPAVDIVALYGALDAQVQDRAIAPSPPGRRKVVLATSIAETSLTIEGVRIVIDSGLARVPRRPHRAGCLLPAMERTGDRIAGSVCAAGNSLRRPFLLRARSRAMGRERSVDAHLPRSAAASSLLRSAQIADRARRARRRRPHHR
jgi:HrpA-like RNA helicase